MSHLAVPFGNWGVAVASQRGHAAPISTNGSDMHQEEKLSLLLLDYVLASVFVPLRTLIPLLGDSGGN